MAELPPCTPESNGIAVRAIQQPMRIARSNLGKAGREEECWFFAVANTVFKTAGFSKEDIKLRAFARMGIGMLRTPAPATTWCRLQVSTIPKEGHFDS